MVRSKLFKDQLTSISWKQVLNPLRIELTTLIVVAICGTFIDLFASQVQECFHFDSMS